MASLGKRKSEKGTSSEPAAPPLTSKTKLTDERTFDLRRRRDQLTARVAELQWDLGGLVYEMAVRDEVRVDVIVKRAAALQDVDAELAEVERILRLEETGTAGVCPSCGSPHSTGASYCWQCGQPLLAQVASGAISGA
jgi:chorismate mutase